jgi:hypothetical protein
VDEVVDGGLQGMEEFVDNFPISQRYTLPS